MKHSKFSGEFTGLDRDTKDALTRASMGADSIENNPEDLSPSELRDWNARRMRILMRDRDGND